MLRHWRTNQRMFQNMTSVLMEATLNKSTDPSSLKFDMFMEHILYNEEFVTKYLPPSDTFYLSSLRKPWERLESHLQYFYRQSNLKMNLGLSTKEKLTYSAQIISKVLTGENKEFIEKVSGKNYSIFTARNSQLLQHGFPPEKQDNSTYIRQFIDNLDFDFVLITEYFDECLVLLKRKLCWGLEDILYVKLRNRKQYEFQPDNTKKDLIDKLELAYRKWSQGDYILYDKMTLKFHQEYRAQKNIKDEVKNFKNVQRKVNAFCQRKTEHYWGLSGKPSSRLGQANSKLVIHKSRFNQEFEITTYDCLLMTLTDDAMRSVLR